MTVEREEESDDVASAIVRLVVHEVRTPLNAICGFADLLLAGAGGPLGREALDYVRQVAEAARGLERGLDQLLAIAAAGAVPMRPALDELGLGPAASQV